MINKNFLEMRTKAKMSLYDIAKATSISYSVLYGFEKEGRDIRLSTACKISKALNCMIDDLI